VGEVRTTVTLDEKVLWAPCCSPRSRVRRSEAGLPPIENWVLVTGMVEMMISYSNLPELRLRLTSVLPSCFMRAAR